MEGVSQKNQGGHAGLFPAKASPTECTVYTLWDRLQPGSF